MKIKAQDLEAESEITEEEYANKIDQIEIAYADRMERILEEIKASFEHAGYQTSDVFDMSDEYLRKNLIVYKEKMPTEDEELNPNDVDINFEISPSIEYDGTTEGINFSINITSVSGRIVGGLTPYNYSSEVWVDVRDDAAIEERFNIFMQANPEEVVDLVEDFWRE